MPEPTTKTPWEHLRAFTDARIALGRAGGSLPTKATLEFEHAHALAKDAVYVGFDTERLGAELGAVTGTKPLWVSSRAEGREVYLTRPDLGRTLRAGEVDRLREVGLKNGPFDVAIIVGDGLSAAAVNRGSGPLLEALLPYLRDIGSTVAPVVLAQGARVALADPVGEALGAKLSLMLIGERPGLSTPESLGAYLTYGPRPGRTDADRNCVSNIHAAGLSYGAAAELLGLLIREAVRLELTGVDLKVETPAELPEGVRTSTKTLDERA